MNSKLTLTVEKSVIEKAKKYARSKGRSLSDIIENYLKSITSDVILDSLYDRAPYSEYSNKVLSLCELSFMSPENFIKSKKTWH